MTVNAARRLLIVAAGALGVAAAAIVIAGSPDTSTVVPSPRPSAAGSPSGGPTQSTAAASPSPAGPTPSSSVRATGPLGAANEAVLVRVVGSGERPEAFEVSLVTLDAGAFETQLQPRVIARLPGSAIPEGYVLNSPAASYGQDGWIGLDVLESATVDRSILVFDLRAPDDPPWVVPGLIVGASWGPASVLAVSGNGEIELYGPDGKTVESVAVPSGVRLHDSDLPEFAPPIWLADGSGFLAWRRGPDLQLGRLDRGGTFAPVEVPPPVFQSTGRERLWGADGSQLSLACPTDGEPEGCSVQVAREGGAPVIWHSAEARPGAIHDYAFDSTGGGVWSLLERVTGEGPLVYALGHADTPGGWTEVASMSLEPPSDGGLEMLGIQDAAPTLDGRHVLIGPQSGDVQVVVSGDGSRGSFDRGWFFAGWAADQGPYPAAAR